VILDLVFYFLVAVVSVLGAYLAILVILASLYLVVVIGRK